MTLRRNEVKQSITGLKDKSDYEDFKSHNLRKLIFENQGVLNDWIAAINQRCYEIMFDLDVNKVTDAQHFDLADSWRQGGSTFHQNHKTGDLGTSMMNMQGSMAGSLRARRMSTNAPFMQSKAGPTLT